MNSSPFTSRKRRRSDPPPICESQGDVCSLPFEVLFEVFSSLNVFELLITSQTCKIFDLYINKCGDTLWKRLYLKIQSYPYENSVCTGGREIEWKYLCTNCFTWDTSASYPIVVSDLNRSARRPENFGVFPLIRTAQKYEGGLFQIAINQPSMELNTISIGLISHAAFVDMRNHLFDNRVVGRVPESYGYAVQYSNDKKATPFLFSEGTRIPSEVYNAGDVIGLSLDVGTEVLSFYKNGRFIGKIEKVAWPMEYFVAVSFASNSHVTIIDALHRCPSELEKRSKNQESKPKGRSRRIDIQ